MAKTNKSEVGVTAELMISEEGLRDKIYTIRGQKVMLDYDLAEIYGYTTKTFNQQVNRNREKFDEDFMFRLTREDVNNLVESQNKFQQSYVASDNNLSRSHFVTSINKVPTLQTKGTKGGRAYLPYAFTEQGVYMLMTVLKGDLATKQSKALIRLFRSMKDYIIENQERIEYRNGIELSLRITDNVNRITTMEKELDRLDAEMKDTSRVLSGVVMKSDLSPVVLDFKNSGIQRELIIMDGELMKASEAYMDIYAKARKSIYVIDNYISIKTLRHLQNVRAGVKIVIFSDNIGKHLHANDYADFKSERKDLEIEFIRTENRVHDRFIIVDYGTKDETIYHSGASEKDAGRKLCVISRYDDGLIRRVMGDVVEDLFENECLVLT